MKRGSGVVVFGGIVTFCLIQELWTRGIIQTVALIGIASGFTYLIIKFLHALRSKKRLQSATAHPLSPKQKTQTEKSLFVSHSISGNTNIDALLVGLDPSILERSGSVFYSGRAAFSAKCPIYILGLNPGGDPEAKRDETISADMAQFRDQSADWSAYLDESWEGRRPGTQGMQPRVLHLIETLGLHPHRVPASNVVFVRSRTEAQLDHEKETLLRAFLPIHRVVIAATDPKVLVCFGATAGKWMRDAFNANLLIDEYRENNYRGWKSQCHIAADGRMVATLSHPSRANWCNPDSDPSILIKRALSRRRQL